MADPLQAFRAIYNDVGEFCLQRGRVSEADTRAKILDRLLSDVLGWGTANIRREVYANPGYIDYVLSDGRPVLVVEAKAVGETFSLPYRKKPMRRLPLSGALMSDDVVNKAVTQVQKYTTDVGARFALATNGYSFILFRGYTEGAAWRAYDAIVFRDFKDVESNFTEFHNLLSYESVRDGAMDAAFRATASRQRGRYSPLAQIAGPEALYGRNPLSHVLRPYVERFFGDIANQDTIDVLQKCYVHSRPIQFIDRDLKLIVSDKLPRFARDAQQVSTTQEDPAGNIGRDIRHLAADSKGKGAFVVLMGGIGSGKSTFIRRFFRVVAPELIEKNSLLVLLNFLGAPNEPLQLEQFTAAQVASELRRQESALSERDALERMFHDDVALIKGLYSKNPEQAETKTLERLQGLATDNRKFSDAALRYCAANLRIPIVVFDNVDQLSDEVQSHIFTTAYRFSTENKCIAVLVLREESYCTARMKKQLTAHAIQPYHLSSPPFPHLLGMRIDSAIDDALHVDVREVSKDGDRYSELVQLFKLLRVSMLGQNKRVVRLVESIAYGNMRLALELFNSFITSGATNIPKILRLFAQYGNYSVPFHEFTKSVMLGEYRYYREQRSLIANVFHATEAEGASHFTALRILRYLAMAHDSGRTSDGFVTLQNILSDIVGVFRDEDDVKKSILRMLALNRQLVELDSRRTDTFEGAGAIRITSSGRYYLDHLVHTFAYLDLVWQDTPFWERSFADSMAKRIDHVQMIERFQRVEAFLDQLGREERQELEEAGVRDDEEGFWGPFVPRFSRFFAREQLIIIKKLQLETDLPKEVVGAHGS